MALPPVCAAGIFHYMLIISLAVLQTVLNVSCLGHQDSVSIISVEVATVNQEADSISAVGGMKEGLSGW